MNLNYKINKLLVNIQLYINKKINRKNYNNKISFMIKMNFNKN